MISAGLKPPRRGRASFFLAEALKIDCEAIAAQIAKLEK